MPNSKRNAEVDARKPEKEKSNEPVLGVDELAEPVAPELSREHQQQAETAGRAQRACDTRAFVNPHDPPPRIRNHMAPTNVERHGKDSVSREGLSRQHRAASQKSKRGPR